LLAKPPAGLRGAHGASTTQELHAERAIPLNSLSLSLASALTDTDRDFSGAADTPVTVLASATKLRCEQARPSDLDGRIGAEMTAVKNAIADATRIQDLRSSRPTIPACTLNP
jgi:hypothetical protein